MAFPICVDWRYTFPAIEMPENAIEQARFTGMGADEFWCVKLLEQTGVVVVPAPL